jgi:DNA-binding transcriptional ArsR family regulator
MDESAEGLEVPPYGPLPVGSGRRTWARRPPDEAEAKALASPLRLRILRITLHEPHTNREIADALGKNPATVLHHVRTLVDTGFLIEQEVRRGRRGSREVPYLASGKSWFMDGGDSGSGGRDLLLETFLQEVGGLPQGSLDSARLGFRLNAADKEKVMQRLQEVLQEIQELPSDPVGESWSLYLGVHPDVSGVPSGHAVDRDH